MAQNDPDVGRHVLCFPPVARTVAEAARRALLRPVSGRIGWLRVGVRYLATAAEARDGGDLYEVLDSA